MRKRFCKVGETYIAVHYNENKVFLVMDTPKQIEVKTWIGSKEVKHIDSYKSEPIDEATFVSKFSGAVAKLHSQIPYA